MPSTCCQPVAIWNLDLSSQYQLPPALSQPVSSAPEESDQYHLPPSSAQPVVMAPELARWYVAPPTFFFGAEGDSGAMMELITTLHIDLGKVLHGEQRFDYYAPVCAGDTLRFESKITDIYDKKGGALEFVVKDTRVTNQLGEHVAAQCTTVDAIEGMSAFLNKRKPRWAA